MGGGLCTLNSSCIKTCVSVMVNETLCKILCHNLVVLIHEMCELGIGFDVLADSLSACSVMSD